MDPIGPSAYNLSARQLRCRLDEVSATQDLWENHGLLVRGEAEDGTDVTLWTSPYVIKRGSADSYYARTATVMQTLLIATDREAVEAGQMTDNDFVAAGWLPADLFDLSELEFANGETNTFRLAGREFVDAPPVWKVSGSHAGVDLDLSLEAIAPGYEVLPFDDFDENGAAWLVAHTNAHGVIRQAGRDLVVDALGSHERAILTRDHFPEKLAGKGLYWHHLLGQDVQAWIMTWPETGEAMARVLVDGQVLAAEGDDVRLEESENWTDPRTGIVVATGWTVEVDTSAGRLRLAARSFARAYYPWIGFRDAMNLLYWMSAEATGEFVSTSGSTTSFDRAKYLGHNNRLFFQRT